MLIINERVARGSLRRRLSDWELTWTRRLQISVGAVRALSYLHNSSIIHHNINTNTILVDENWEAKISGFEYSITIPARDLDVAYEKLGIGIYKSDVFSIGVVLFELLCGKKAFTSEDYNGFQVSLAIFNYENRTLNNLVDPGLFSQMDPLSFKIFSDTAYSCLNNQRSPPTMDEVLKRLERALKVQQMRDNNEHSAVPVERTIPDHLKLKLKSIEHMRIPLADILSATGNFTKGGIVSAGGFGSVYEAELEHVDKAYCFATERKNDHEMSKKRSKVAIKRITDTEDEIAQQGFYAEIKMLTSCKHSNIITLLGFCDEQGEMILIYEYASNGSLNYHLQNKSVNHNDSWAQRVKICLDVAKGLSFLHANVGDRKEIVHRDIKSANILLDENFEAKIGDFGLSLFLSVGKQHSTRYTREVAGTMAYMDPQYYKDAKLKKELDVYSFGVILFEILCGAVTYDRKYVENNKRGLAFVARQYFEKGIINEIVDQKIKEEINESLLTSIIGHDQKSLDTFSKIAYKCLAEAQEDRPTMKVVVEELEKALFFQTNRVKKVQLQEILVATNHFSEENLMIQEGELGNLYKGTLFQSGKLMDIVARRFNRKHGQGDVEFQTEISMLSSLKHKNIISIFGAVDEKDEKIAVYDLASHGTLHQHLIDPTDLDGSRRLQICLGVARALNHIHCDVIHCDINSFKIFLDKDREPKIFGFEFSTNYPQSWRHRLLYSRHFHNPSMTPKFDVHCFGVLMFEILCGRKPVIREDHDEEEEVDDLVDPNLRKQMDTRSFNNFLNIAKTCLKKDPMERPTMDQIVKKLGEVLEPQRKHKNLEHSAADEDASTKRQIMDFLKIPLREIRQATDGFDKRYYLGNDGYSEVYKAELNLSDIQSMSSMKFIDEPPKKRKTVAIKRITTRQDEQDKKGFLLEIELLSSRKHPNIASLLGFCAEGGETIFVFDFAFRGSLNDYFGRKFMDNFTWAQRIQISLDIAYGIRYLHSSMEGILHGDLRSENILLDENLNAKVTGFGLSKFRTKESTIQTKHIADSQVYLDPKYFETGKYKKESDVYSFGVVLFEIMSWRLAYDKIYMMENDAGLAPIARQRFNEGKLKELIDPKIIEDDKHIFTINRGPNQDSFDAFSKIAYQCLSETHAKRPTMEAVIKELQNALILQGETIELIRFKLSDILLATQNFSEAYCIGVYEYGIVYKADLYFHKERCREERYKVAVQRIFVGENGQGEERFFSEIEKCISCNHPNIVSILGFCDEHDEKILVYEHASNNSLDDYLKSDNIISLTWTQRLHVCLDISHGLNHIHTKMDPQSHGDIRSANVILDNNLEAKVAYFGIPKLHLPNQEVGLKVYRDPEYEKTGKLEKESDVYSFGVVMFEIFCGRVAYDPVYMDKNEKGLASVALRCVNDGTIKKLIDPKLMEETDHDEGTFTSSRRPNQDSLDTYLGIAYKCLGETRATRPTLKIVIKELERAVNFQVGERN